MYYAYSSQSRFIVWDICYGVVVCFSRCEKFVVIIDCSVSRSFTNVTIYCHPICILYNSPFVMIIYPSPKGPLAVLQLSLLCFFLLVSLSPFCPCVRHPATFTIIKSQLLVIMKSTKVQTLGGTQSSYIQHDESTEVYSHSHNYYILLTNTSMPTYTIHH